MKNENLVKCNFSKKTRTVEIIIGGIYVVNPMNPQKKKYRGEIVKLIEHDPFGKGTSVLRLDSEWHVKRNHYSQIDICDLELKKRK